MRNRDHLHYAITLLVSLALAPAAAGFQGEAGGFRSFQDVLGAWRDSAQIWSHLAEDEGRARSHAFLKQFGALEILEFCSEPADEQTAGAREGFVKARLLVASLPIADLILLLTDRNVHFSCKSGIMHHVRSIREQIASHDREALGRAFLEMADSDDFPVGIVKQLENAAAQFSTADTLLGRMERYVDAGSEQMRVRGFEMLALSSDPRGRDLMTALLDRYLEEGNPPPRRILMRTGSTLGALGFDYLMEFLARARGESERDDVLEGIVAGSDPRALEIILAEYADQESGIRDDTADLEDRDARGRYFRLYRQTRMLEPLILEALGGARADLLTPAIELLDRESRYGVAEHWEQIQPALRALAARPTTTPAERERLEQIMARFEQREAVLQRRVEARQRR